MIDLGDVNSSSVNSVQIYDRDPSAIHISAVCGIKRSVEYPDIIRGCLRKRKRMDVSRIRHHDAFVFCVSSGSSSQEVVRRVRFVLTK